MGLDLAVPKYFGAVSLKTYTILRCCLLKRRMLSCTRDLTDVLEYEGSCKCLWVHASRMELLTLHNPRMTLKLARLRLQPLLTLPDCSIPAWYMAHITRVDDREYDDQDIMTTPSRHGWEPKMRRCTQILPLKHRAYWMKKYVSRRNTKTILSPAGMRNHRAWSNEA